MSAQQIEQNMVTQLQAIVITYQGNFTFSGTEASAVVSAVKAHQDILAKCIDEYSVQIPYTSVTQVSSRVVQVESTTEDDNCKVQTPEPEVESLSIQNGGQGPVLFTLTLGDTSINGTYGDFTFTNGVAQASIAAGGKLTLTGVADGTSYTISGSVTAQSGSLTGTTPATVVVISRSV